jgi:hypothetical protein
LEKKQYHITRNNQKGTIQIDLQINDKNYSNVYNGFKVDVKAINNIDASLSSKKIISNDLNDDTITQLLKLNNFDSRIAESLHFQIVKVDDHAGTADIKIIKCDDDDLTNSYMNRVFTIENLAPYFIEQNMHPSEEFLSKKPSEISLIDFKNNFLNISDEFNARHQNDLSIALEPNDHEHKLTAKITYKNSDKDTSVTFSYNFDNHKLIKNIGFIVAAAGILTVGLLILGIVIYQKMRRRKLK